MKILLSGGHLTPALAFIEYIQTYESSTELIFVGRHYSQEKLKQLSHEAQEAEKHHVPFVEFRAPRLGSSSILHLLVACIPLSLATWRAIWLIHRLQPSVFLSFGGYVAMPLAIACWINRVPVVTHEQTRAAGLANQTIAQFAQKIALSYPSSQAYFAAKKTVVTGNPVRQALFQPQARPTWITESPTKPILYITGGNQGSEVINTVTKQALRPLLNNYFVIHQCGSPTLRRNYKAELEETQKKLPSTQRAQYCIREWVTEAELGWIYQHTAIVVSRAGANTISELIAHRLPALLIPLPFAHHDEQQLNAQYMKELGGAEILDQKNLNSANLLKKIALIKKYHKTMKDHLTASAVDSQAAKKLFVLVSEVAHH